MGVALSKIRIYLAKKDTDKFAIYLGATKNHAETISRAAAAAAAATQSGVVLFLEDDFVFAGDEAETAAQLQEFWRRNYNYDVCLLAASKMHERAHLDDLVSISRQCCTTSSAYFIPIASLAKIKKIVCDGVEKMIETGDYVSYCIDRYWAGKLQSAGRMILFKQKLGFQRPSVSKITGELNIMLD
jgi:hypothetical protein